MAFLKGDIYSEVLCMETSVCVILPQDRRREGVSKTLYLLHGYSDNDTCWTRFTSVERYANEQGIAVVMPEAAHSYYTNMRLGMKYGDFFADELPELCQRLFHLPQAREDTYVAGLSMGGFGALRLGLTRPDRFGACAGFSSVTDIRGRIPHYREEENANEFMGLFGPGWEMRDKDDLFLLAGKAAALPEAQRPAVYQACGLQDGLYRDNQLFKAKMESLPLRYCYEEWEGGHNWAFWDQAIQKALAFFASL